MKGVHYAIIKVSKIKYNIWACFRYLYNLYKSIVFNFTYLPFDQAKSLPIWVESLSFGKEAAYTGKIVIESDTIKHRMIMLGVRYNSWYPYAGISLQNFGTIIFKGQCIIGNSSAIYVGSGCTLTIGDDTQMSSSSKVICETGITIGRKTRIGWNSLLMDTNFHYMTNILDGSTNEKIKAPITIGQHNWFGNNCSIFKGFTTTDYVTIGSGSKCRGKIDKMYSVWSNDGKLHLLQENVYRDLGKDRNMYNEL